MDLSPYIDQLRRDLLQAAALGDENTQRIAATLANTASASARLALMTALSDLAAEITAVLGDTSVEVRLDGQDVRVTVINHDVTEHFDADDDARFDPDAVRGSRTRTDQTTGESEGDGDREGWSRAVKDASQELSRTTVRLFNDLKSQAETAASDQGMSLNTYISRAVADSVRGASARGRGKPGKRAGRTVNGWIHS